MMTLVEDSDVGADKGATVEHRGRERRRGLRIDQQRPAKVYEPRAGRYVGGVTRDVSASGLKLELPVSTFVAPGSMLSVQLGLQGGGQGLTSRNAMAPTRVVWVDRGAGGTLLAGVEFVPVAAVQLDAA